MSELALNIAEMDQPSPDEIEAARVAARALAKVPTGRMVRFTVEKNGEDAPAGEPIEVPAQVFRTIVKLLVEVGNGNAVQVVPMQAELTTQQAADLLNVSRPHFIKLLDKGDIRFRMVGTHRKVRGQDVLTYRDQCTAQRRTALNAMVAADEEAGLYEDEPIGAKVP